MTANKSSKVQEKKIAATKEPKQTTKEIKQPKQPKKVKEPKKVKNEENDESSKYLQINATRCHKHIKHRLYLYKQRTLDEYNLKEFNMTIQDYFKLIEEKHEKTRIENKKKKEEEEKNPKTQKQKDEEKKLKKEEEKKKKREKKENMNNEEEESDDDSEIRIGSSTALNVAYVCQKIIEELLRNGIENTKNVEKLQRKITISGVISPGQHNTYYSLYCNLPSFKNCNVEQQEQILKKDSKKKKATTNEDSPEDDESEQKENNDSSVEYDEASKEKKSTTSDFLFISHVKNIFIEIEKEYDYSVILKDNTRLYLSNLVIEFIDIAVMYSMHYIKHLTARSKTMGDNQVLNTITTLMLLNNDSYDKINNVIEDIQKKIKFINNSKEETSKRNKEIRESNVTTASIKKTAAK